MNKHRLGRHASGGLLQRCRSGLNDRAPGMRRGQNGRPLGMEHLERRELLSIQPLASHFSPVDSPGTLVYEQQFADTISSATEVDRFAVELPADHVVSVTVDGDSGLRPKVELFGPNEALLATDTAANLSGQAALTGLRTSQAGSYTISVSAVGESLGDYGVRLLLNSTVESESVADGVNDSAASAQSLQSVFVGLGDGAAELASVAGSLPGYSEGFEGRRLDHHWSTCTPKQAVTEVTGYRGAAQGDSALLLHWKYDGDDMDSPQEAIWTVDMSGLAEPVLSFQAAAWLHRTHSFNGPYTGHFNASGVSISADGEHWFPVADVDPDDDWTQYTVDLAAEAGAAGISLDGELQVKFQRWGQPMGDEYDGLAYDAITIRSTTENTDWYRFSLDDGQAASVWLAGDTLGSASVELYDSSLNLLTASVAVGEGASLIHRFVDTTTDSSSNEYYVKVAGRGMEYEMSVLRGGDFYQPVPGRAVQELIAGVPVLGGIFWERPIKPGPVEPPQAHVFQIAASTGDQLQIRTRTPLEKTYFYPAALDPLVRLRAPDGTIVATDDNGAQDGMNALLGFTVPLAGTYTIEVEGSGYTSGEYLLEVDGATGQISPFTIERTTPSDGAAISDPTIYLIHFSHSVLASSVQAADLRIDGQPASSARLVDGMTVEFALPNGLTAQTHTVTMAAGAIRDLAGRGASALAATFVPDLFSPQLLASTLNEGDVVGLGTLAVNMEFSEPLLASVLDPSDVTLVGTRTGIHALSHFAYDETTSTLDLRFADLEDDAYTLMLVSGDNAFRDPVGHGLDGGNLVIHFAAQAENAPLSGFESVGPLGNQAYRAEIAGRVADATDDTYLLDLTEGQPVTLRLQAQPTLRSTVELIRPDGSVAATATAAGSGEIVELTSVTSTAGVHRIAVRGAGGSLGDYRLETLLNAVRAQGGVDELAARNVSGSFHSLPGEVGERLVILGELHALGQSFDSAEPAEGWSWDQSSGPNRVFVSSEWGSVDGETALMMQGTPKVSANWQVDISGMTDPTLSFWHASWEGAGNSAFPYGPTDCDGILLQTMYGLWENWDGGLSPEWTPERLVWTPPDQETGEWVHYSLNLAELAQQYPEPFGPEIRLTFCRAGDDKSLPNGGRGWDAIVLTSSDPIGEWYELTLEDGQSASLVMAAQELDAQCRLEIYDDIGRLLALGAAGEDGSSSIHGFQDRTSDGAADTYRIRAAGVVAIPTWPYTLTVTRDAGFNAEPKDETEPQLVKTGAPVMGHVSALAGDRDTYGFSLPAGATIDLSTATPAVGAGPLANLLDPRLELYGPDGTLVAGDDNSGPGQNAALSHVAATAGTYTVQVIPVAASGGDYVLSIDTSPTGSASFAVLGIQPVPAPQSTIPPLEITFNADMALDTLDGADFVVNGLPAESVEWLDSRTVVVHPRILTSGAWNVSIPSASVLSLGGTPVEACSRTVAVSISDAVLPGGLLDETTFQGAVAATGQVDKWQVRLIAGQIMTAAIAADDSLSMRLRLLAPDGTQLAVHTGTAGKPLVVEYAASLSGNYTIEVSGVDSSTGAYSGTLTLDALVERETTQGTPNNTKAAAESLDGTFIDLGDADGQRAAARGMLPGSWNVLAAEDFEWWEYKDDPALPDGWTSDTTRTRFSEFPKTLPATSVEKDTWNSYLVLGTTVTVTYVEEVAPGDYNIVVTGHENDIPHYYEANWPVDLSGASAPLTLSFDTYFRGGPYNPAPFSGSFTDRVDASGIAISADGITWHPIWELPDQQYKAWNSYTVDLSAAVQAAGISLGPNMWIRLQYYAVPDQDSEAPEVRFDSLMIGHDQPTEDWYCFTLADGQAASLMADNAASLQMELYDSQSHLLAEGIRAVNVEQAVNLFADTSTNGQPDTYYVRITGSQGPYSLVVTRDAALDVEPNRNFQTAQEATGAGGVLGNLGDRAPWAADPADSGQPGNISRVADFAGLGFRGVVPSSAGAAVGAEVVVAVAAKDDSANFGHEGADLCVYDKATGRELARHNLSAVLDVGVLRSVLYPSVSYDAESGRFFLAAIDYAEDLDNAIIRIAVSKDSTPVAKNDWDVFEYDLTRDLGELGPAYVSYFELALGDDAVWLTGPYASFSPWMTESDPYAGIFALDKTAMLNGEQGEILFERQIVGDHATPVVQEGSNLVQYFASADAEGGSAITLHAVAGLGSMPTYQAIQLTVPEFDRAVGIEQDGDVLAILAGSARIRTGAWHDGSLWIAHPIADPVDDGDAVVRWYEIKTNSFPNGVPTLVQMGDLDPGVGTSAFSPAIAVNADGQTGLAYLAAGKSLYVSACFTGRSPSDPLGQMQPAALLAEGRNVYAPGITTSIERVPYYPLSNQQSLVVDPVDRATFWMLGEYASATKTWETRIGAFQMGTPGGEDWFATEVSVGETIELETRTPGDTWLADSQRLDPMVELYAPDGTLAATNQNGASDGRNARLVHTATQSGRYRIRVVAEHGSYGEYFLRIGGLAATNSAPEVVAVSPSLDVSYGQLPEFVTLTFSEPLRPTTVQAGDLRLGGKPALSVAMESPNVLKFEIDPAVFTGTGTYPLLMSAGTVSDIAGLANRGFQSSIVIDARAPQVAEVLVNGQATSASRVYPEGPVEFAVRFDEQMFLFPGSSFGPLGPNSEGIELLGHISGRTWLPDSVSYDAEQHILTVGFDNVSEDLYSLTLASGDTTFKDHHGNILDGDGDNLAGGDYVFNFAVDMTTGSRLAFSQRPPFGSLIVEGRETAAVVSEPGDVDEYTFYAQSGQTIAITAQPADSSALVTVGLVGIGASASSGTPGGIAYLAPYHVSSDGLLTLRLTANKTTQVDLHVVVNAAVEAGDSSQAQALAVDNTVVGDAAWHRWAVVGSTRAQDTEDSYTLDLTGWAGRSVDIVLAGDDAVRAAGATLQLVAADRTTVLATASANPLGESVLNYDQGILDFEIPADGRYTLRLAAAGALEYSIVVTADTPFDTELRDGAQSPRSLDAGQSAVGYLSPESPLLFVVDTGVNEAVIHTINAITGKIVNSFPAPFMARTASYGVNLAFDGLKLYYNVGGTNGDPKIYVLDGRDGTVLDTFQTTATTNRYQALGLAYLDGKLFVADVDNASLAEIDVYDSASGQYERSFSSPVLLGLGGDYASGMLYGVNPVTYEIVRIDPATGEVLKTMPSGVGAPQGAAVIGDELFVSHSSGAIGREVIVAYDISTMIERRRVLVPIAPSRAIGGLGGDGHMARFIPGGGTQQAAGEIPLVACEPEDLPGLDWLFAQPEDETTGPLVCVTGFGSASYQGDEEDVLPPVTERISPDAQRPLAMEETENNDSPAFAQELPLGFGDGESTAVLLSGSFSADSDVDCYLVHLDAGDVFAVRTSGNASWAAVKDYRGELIQASGSRTSGYPVSSPLFSDARTSLAFVAEAPGTYCVEVHGRKESSSFQGPGDYFLDLEVLRPYLESQPVGAHQILYLDFDGASLDSSFHNVAETTLSPLADFLPSWGLDPDTDLDAVIDAIIAQVEQSLSQGIRACGVNGDFQASGAPGQFDIEILNSRDHGEQFGNPNVSRVIIGGTVGELGIETIGIAQSIDVGNFDTEETVVVLLDYLSASPEVYSGSLNAYPIDPSSSMIELVGRGVGRVAAHETGHIFGNWHTDRDNELYGIMEPGGRLAGLIGLGEDGIFATNDDVEVEFIYDVYSPREYFKGFENTAAVLAYGLSTGKGDDAGEGPTVLAVDLNAPADDHLDIRSLTVEFSSPVEPGSATRAANYRLIEAGSDGLFEGGAGDDRTIPLAASIDGDDMVELTIAAGDAPLPLGRYQLTIQGTNGGIADLEGDNLGADAAHPDGRDFAVEFEVAVPDIGDWYQIFLTAGSKATLWTETPFDAAQSGVVNDLDARMLVISPNQGRILHDQDSADGKNPKLEFTAEESGYYLIRVAAASGEGEYVLLNKIDGGSPMVMAQYPATTAAGSIDSIRLSFSHDIDPSSFSLSADLISFTGPGGTITPSGFSWQSPSELVISFPTQTAQGHYELILAPTIVSVSGYALNQDGDDTPGETPDDRYVASFSLVSATDLGTVIYRELAGVDPSQGELVYRVAPYRSGLMTILGTPAGSGSVQLRFHNEASGEELASSLVGGSQRIDLPLQADDHGLLFISGSAASVNIVLANLVQRDGATVNVFGTDDADPFELDASSGFDVSIKGVSYHFNTDEVNLIAFDGGLGDDTAVMTGTSGDEGAVLWPDHGEMTGTGWKATVGEVVSIGLVGGGGYDLVQMYDSPGDDCYQSAAGLSTLSGPGYLLSAEDFGASHAYGKFGGNDTAVLRGPETGPVKFKADAVGQWSKLYNTEFFTRAKFFEIVEAYSRGNLGVARLFDSNDDDLFTGQKDESRMAGPGYDVTVYGFTQLTACSYAGGHDTATLIDSELDDEVRFRAHKTQMYDLDTKGNLYMLTVRAFDEVHSQATCDGHDKAKFHDTARDDLFEALGQTARLSTRRTELELLYEAIGFEFVKAYHTQGTDRTAVSNPINFELYYEGDWESQ